MSVIVNARDIQLQATVPRLAGVSLADNIVVDPSQVDGLGLVILNAKSVKLTASSQIFQIPKSGSVSPASITLTAHVYNLVGTPSLTIDAGGGTMSVTPALDSGNTFTFTAAQMTSDTVRFLLSVTDGSDTYTDEYTVAKLREGSDAITGFLTNETHTVPGDFLGNVTNYAGAGGLFKVYLGTVDITASCTFALAPSGNPQAVTYTLTASGSSAGTYALTADYPTSVDNITLKFRATFGSVTLDKIFTVSKARSGAGGDAAPNLYLSANKQAFTFDGKNARSPTSQTITFTAVDSNLTGTPSWTATGYDDTGTSLGALTLGGTSTSATRTLSGSNFGSIAAYAVVSVTWDGLVDTITVVKLRDGVNAIVTYLTNEVAVVGTLSDGSGGTYTSAGGTFKVFDGLSDQTGTAGPTTYAIVSGTTVGLSVSINSTTGVYTITACSTDTGSVTFRATYQSVTYDKTYSLSKSKAGSVGPDGQRGSRTFYVALSGTTHVWSSTLATTTATVDGGPVLNDVVTQYNNSQSFSETRFWNGTSWIVVNAVVDGNLLVSGTVGAAALVANSITANEIAANTLTANEIAANAITASEIAADAVTSIKILADAVTANKISVTSLSAVSATIGTLRTATTGARMEVLDNKIRIYDSSNVLRVKIGDLS